MGGTDPVTVDAGAPDSGSLDGGAVATGPDGGAGPGATDGGAPGWTVVAREDFEALDPGAPAWSPDLVPDDGPFSDAGLYFTLRGVVPPTAFRISQPLGAGGWLTAESYTRDSATTFADLVSVVPDPSGAANHALRICSPRHTDATVIRSTSPLPERYRISLRVGFPQFGDGQGLNGYQGGETAGPWWPNDSALAQNGFYWLTILDAEPRPHNNTYIHHHRKVVMDSDNNNPPWMEIFDGKGFTPSGVHPLMMIALDGRTPGPEPTGNPFLAYSGGVLQPSSADGAPIRAVDAYVPDTWYHASIERDGAVYTMEVSGRFQYGGDTTYRVRVDAAEHCLWHYPRTAAEAAGAAACVDEGSYPELGPAFPPWPAGGTWPDWFMFGDPHVNYYRGEVLYDDVTLEVWSG